MKTPQKLAAYLAANERGEKFVQGLRKGLDEETSAAYAGSNMETFTEALAVAIKVEKKTKPTAPEKQLISWLEETRRSRAAFQLSAISLAAVVEDSKTIARLAERLIDGKDSSIYWADFS